jgi:hypothetical protein
VWKNIQPELIEFMETMKAFRIERERSELLKRRRVCASTVLSDFKRKCPDILAHPNELMPGSPDFWSWYPVRTIIESPNDTVVTTENFDDILEDISKWIVSWREARIQELVFKTRMHGLPYPGDRFLSQLAQLQLAVCVVTCQRHLCPDEEHGWGVQEHNFLYYPEYLHHRCNAITWRQQNKPDEGEAALSLGSGYPKQFIRQKWSSEKLEFDGKASGVVKKIIETCGWNWKTMTAKELDKLDPRLVCLKCTWGHRCDGEWRVTVRNWRSAV